MRGITPLGEWYFPSHVVCGERESVTDKGARYGLGTVYLKQNKLRKAEYHFRKAVEISPSNAVLISCEGTVSRGLLLLVIWPVSFSRGSQLRCGTFLSDMPFVSDSFCLLPLCRIFGFNDSLLT